VFFVRCFGLTFSFQKAFEEAPSTKHSGFFINKGKVELRPEGSHSSKKRKRMAVELDRPRSPVKAHKQHVTLPWLAYFVHANAAP
jgi:hypothetical protein